MYPGTFARSDPDRPAVLFTGTGRTVTFGELEDRSVRLANYLHDVGLRRGDVIALSSYNHPSIFEIYWAAQRSGLYATAINPRLSPAEFQYILADSGAKALFLGPGTGPVIPGIQESHQPAHCVLFDHDGELPAGFADYDAVLAAGSPTPPSDQPRGADMLYSSGTTGRPKGIKPPLPTRQVDEAGDTMIAMFGERLGLDETTVYLSPAPLYHAAPLRFSAMVQALGGTVVVMEKFDAEAALAAIEHYGVTHSQWVPTMFIRMLKLPDDVRNRYDLSTLRIAVHAAAPCPVEVKHKMMDWWGPILHEFYSSTELNGATMITPEEWLKKPGSVGRAVLGIPRICNDEGVDLGANAIGTIYFERDAVPFEYHHDPERTKQAAHPDHPTWTTVGDLGYVDDDDYLFLTDRKDFMIISGGVNIYPREIEDVLALHPVVADVGVIGVPDPEMGEQVKAFVQLAPGMEGSDELVAELIDFVKSKVASYKAPRSVDFIAELPRLPTGKLAKGVLKTQYGGPRLVPAGAGPDQGSHG